MHMRILVAVMLLACLSACRSKPASIEDLTTRDVTLPGGQVLRVDTMLDARDMLRGMMFRKTLPPDQGALFVHMRPGNYGYWMYQTYIPLDIVWMDSSRRIVEIVADAPPCKTEASQCTHYGGTYPSQYVLEIGAGLAAKYGLHPGDVLLF